MPDQRLFYFTGGSTGSWKVTSNTTVAGEPIPPAAFVEVTHGAPAGEKSDWVFRGITSNERYVEAREKTDLVARQEGLGRPGANLGAMILIRKNANWWRLSQSERRDILENQSAHIKIGLKYLPQVARRLHHCRDLGENEPFDFVTWFEFSRAHETDFDNLVNELRATTEWKFVDREADIRMERRNNERSL